MLDAATGGGAPGLGRRRALALSATALAGLWLRGATAVRGDGVEPPPFARSRDAWRAAAPRGGLRPHTVERITLHHTGPPAWFGVPSAPAYLRQIQGFHQGPERGWPDIAYHLLIDLEGTVWEGRPLGVAGDTATDYDPTGHALIAVLGDYDVQQPGEAQRRAIVGTVRWLAERFGLEAAPPAGHRDYAATACPGRNLTALLAAWGDRRSGG